MSDDEPGALGVVREQNELYFSRLVQAANTLHDEGEEDATLLTFDCTRVEKADEPEPTDSRWTVTIGIFGREALMSVALAVCARLAPSDRAFIVRLANERASA